MVAGKGHAPDKECLMHLRTRRSAAIFLLTLVLALPALAQPAGRAEPWTGSRLIAVLWERAASLLGVNSTGVTSKSRGSMDPNGASTSATTSDDGESRGSFDPNG